MNSHNNPCRDCVDASSTSSDAGTKYAPLRVRIYGDGDGDDDDNEASLGAASSEVFDSASEHMDALFDTDSVSLMGPFKDSLEVPSIDLKRALLKLNELNSGIASLDTSFLDNMSEEDFRFRLMEISAANCLSLDDDIIHDILNTLVPLFRARCTQKRNATFDWKDHTQGMPVAKLTGDDDSCHSEKSDDDSCHSEKSDDADADLIMEDSDADQSENAEFLPYSAQGLPIRVADDANEEQEVPNTLLHCDPVESGQGCAFGDETQFQSTSDSGEHFSEAVEFGSVSHSANALGTCALIQQQPVGAKERVSQIMNAARLDQHIPEPIESSVHAFNSYFSSSQEETASNTSEKGPVKEGHKGRENRASRDKLISKYSTDTASNMPKFDEAGFLGRPAGLGHFNSCTKPGILFSKADSLKGRDDPRGMLQVLRLKLLRLAIRLQQSTNHIVRQVLYRLDVADRLRGGSGLTWSDLENLRFLAEGLEARRLGSTNFECTILVLGKSGVGKSATVNSLFGNFMSETDAFKPATKKVKEITGTVNGLTLRVIDTPGFLTSGVDEPYNLKIMSSIKYHIKKSPPDAILYVDRLDLQCREYGEWPLFRAISNTLGTSIWYKTVVVFTHGCSALLDEINGVAEDYKMFIAQRLHIVQESICLAARDIQLRNLHSIVENHAARQISKGSCFYVPKNDVWQPQLLFRCFASKILKEAGDVLRPQQETLWVHPQAHSLSFLFASVFQSQAHWELPHEQVIDEEESDSDREAIESDSKNEFEDLPFFRCLNREELISLNVEHREFCHEEQKHRKKLCLNQRLEAGTRKQLKRGLAASAKEASDLMDKNHEKTNGAAAPVAMRDMPLPLSFDSDNTTHRYCSLDTMSELRILPVHTKHGWDHDIGYNGLSIEKAFLIAQKLPVSVSGQIIKDKKDTNVQLECATSCDKERLQACLNIVALKKDIAYNLHAGTKFSSSKKHTATCGLAITMIRDTYPADIKLEDSLVINKCARLAIDGGVVAAKQEVAYGGYLRAFFKGRHFRFLSSIGLSMINWKKDVSINGICQVRFLLGQNMITGQANLNNIRGGQIKVCASSSDQVQIALLGLVPLLRILIFNWIPGFSKLLE